MRALFLSIIMLLVPVSGADLSAPFDGEENNEKRWIESVITSDNEPWNDMLWNSIEQSGAYPLRTISSNELLVWHSTDFKIQTGFTTVSTSPALWKGSQDFTSFTPDLVRILFEPRLPDFAFNQISTDLSLLGIYVADLVNLEYSVMPNKIVVNIDRKVSIDDLQNIPGVLWIEPVLTTHSRNVMASAYMADGYPTTQPHWDFGLNGQGVILGVADSGIDDDHSCFRNDTDSVGEIGSNHRKILVSNTSIDDGDNPGQSDYRHGTHVAGSLVCHDVYTYVDDEVPNNGSTIAYKAKLIFQDIVSDDGWMPPENVTELLLENSQNGGIIHSNSWGDDTTAYTDRTADFDYWALEVPWSLSLIAPGNTGNQLLEPANGRNVVAIGAITKSSDPELWPSSSVGPTELGTYGIFAVAPGVSINSAKADGFDDSLNDALRVSSGTSMATPIAASFAGVVQQMVEQGWILGANEALFEHNLSDITPNWSVLPNESIFLGEGFAPSGPLLRSLLALSTRDMLDDNTSFTRNNQTGWGVLSLDELIDFNKLEISLGEANLTPASNVWIHDSFRPTFDILEWLDSRIDASGDADITNSPWNGAGSAGPFLQSGEDWTKRLVPNLEDDFEIIMSYSAKPEPFMIDDLRLRVELSDGRVAVAENYNPHGYSYLLNATEFLVSEPIDTNETSVGIKLSRDDLIGVEWMDIVISANYVSPGGSAGTVGLDGDRVGFALAAKGVIRDSNNWEDSDSDGLPNAVDNCPNENSLPFDLDNDGCPDDSDNDGILDEYDLCPEIDAFGFDSDLNGCIDDSDNDGIGDNQDLCETIVIDSDYPVDGFGCRPIDSVINISDSEVIGLVEGFWSDSLEVRWQIHDEDLDPYLTGARIMINQTGNHSFFPIANCIGDDVTTENGIHKCVWYIPGDLPIFDITDFSLHVQFFAQSLNESPEGNNGMVYLDSSIYFSTLDDNYFVSDNNNIAPGSSNATRALGWGLITILSVAIILQRLYRITVEKTESPRTQANLTPNPFTNTENE